MKCKICKQDHRKASACYAVGDPYRDDIAFNTQPGHIPERARVIRAQERGFEHSNMADHHESKADGIQRQLDFSGTDRIKPATCGQHGIN